MAVQAWQLSLLTSMISTVGAFVSVWYGRRAVRAERLASAEELAVRFREPLLQAVFNLETRIFNILQIDFFGRFRGPKNTSEEREYAELNTVYVFAQYFCWVEILRREAQFLDPRNAERDELVVRTLEDIRDLFSVGNPDRTFRIFRGEQRALGEVMLVQALDPGPREPRWACLGYSQFVEAVDDPPLDRWCRPIRADIAAIAASGELGAVRLREVQRRLVDILDVLDPQAQRISADLRRRVDPPVSRAAMQ
jgi:hypothetical protein